MNSQQIRTPEAAPTASDIGRGDDNALAAHWTEAVAAWERTLSTVDGDRARARLAWLASQGDIAQATSRDRWWSGPIAVGFCAVVVATGLVLVAEGQSPSVSNVLAVMAWGLYVVAAGCGLLYAYRHRPRNSTVSDATLVSQAMAVAIAVENGSGTIGAGSGPVS